MKFSLSLALVLTFSTTAHASAGKLIGEGLENLGEKMILALRTKADDALAESINAIIKEESVASRISADFESGSLAKFKDKDPSELSPADWRQIYDAMADHAKKIPHLYTCKSGCANVDNEIFKGAIIAIPHNRLGKTLREVMIGGDKPTLERMYEDLRDFFPGKNFKKLVTENFIDVDDVRQAWLFISVAKRSIGKNADLADAIMKFADIENGDDFMDLLLVDLDKATKTQLLKDLKTAEAKAGKEKLSLTQMKQLYVDVVAKRTGKDENLLGILREMIAKGCFGLDKTKV